MKYVITGAGQIGQQLATDLVARGDEVVVVRRREGEVPGARMVRGDAGDREMLDGVLDGAAAVFHCIHAAYDARAWQRELPARERAVMDAAAGRGIPVVFPESVYAFGLQSDSLREGSTCMPCSPLGEVRAQLLAARHEHEATTVSVVASDLIGPTAGGGSVGTTTVIQPVVRGRTAWVIGDPDAAHSWTYLPDLSRAMIHTADQANSLAPTGDAVLHAPTPQARSLRDLARDTAAAAGVREARVRRVPSSVLAPGAPFSRLVRELRNQGYLWERPAVLQPGVLTTEHGLEPTDWDAVVDECVRAAATPA